MSALFRAVDDSFKLGRTSMLTEVRMMVRAERAKSRRARRGKTTNAEWVHHGEVLDILRLLLKKLDEVKP